MASPLHSLRQRPPLLREWPASRSAPSRSAPPRRTDGPTERFHEEEPVSEAGRGGTASGTQLAIGAVPALTPLGFGKGRWTGADEPAPVPPGFGPSPHPSSRPRHWPPPAPSCPLAPGHGCLAPCPFPTSVPVTLSPPRVRAELRVLLPEGTAPLPCAARPVTDPRHIARARPGRLRGWSRPVCDRSPPSGREAPVANGQGPAPHHHGPDLAPQVRTRRQHFKSRHIKPRAPLPRPLTTTQRGLKSLPAPVPSSAAMRTPPPPRRRVSSQDGGGGGAGGQLQVPREPHCPDARTEGRYAI